MSEPFDADPDANTNPDPRVGGSTGPRVLVVRSGANPFARLPTRTGMEIVERVSHSIVPLSVLPAIFDRHEDYVVFTSQVTVERLLSDAALAPAVRRVIAGTWSLYWNGLVDGASPRPAAWTGSAVQRVASGLARRWPAVPPRSAPPAPPAPAPLPDALNTP